jgi:hypothetical protein
VVSPSKRDIVCRGNDRRLWRSLMSVVTILVGALHLAAVFHFTFVRHELCAEHGHLTHAREPAANVPGPSELSAAALRADGNEAPHDHCLPAGARENPLLLPDPGHTEIAIAEPQSVAAPAFDAGPRATTDILSMAPKQSPPWTGRECSAAGAS